MNGLDLYNFMYDQFVWPKHPFASRDVRHREGLSVSQEAAGEPSPCREQDSAPAVRNAPGASEREGRSISPGDADAHAGARAVEMSASAESATPPPRSRSVIVLADRRRKEKT